MFCFMFFQVFYFQNCNLESRQKCNSFNAFLGLLPSINYVFNILIWISQCQQGLYSYIVYSQVTIWHKKIQDCIIIILLFINKFKKTYAKLSQDRPDLLIIFLIQLQKIPNYLQLAKIMFCCQKHQCELITSICQQPQCQQPPTSSLCCSECIREHHHSHTTVSMKKILPQLLSANNQKKYYIKLLQKLVNFMNQEFGSQDMVKMMLGGGKVQIGNVGDVVEAVVLELRKKNKEENRKIRDIQKTLKINNESEKANSPGKQYHSVLIKPATHFQFGRQSNIPLSSSQLLSLQTFSHSLKHPYITLSPDMHSVIKSSQASGYKLAALSSAALPQDNQNIFINVKVVKSSGNVLLGLAIPEIIREKEYLNCYGAGQGAFLMGQNGNDALSSILFHHSDNVFNRKQIVGWNYKQGQVLGIGVIKQEQVQLVSFRKYHLNSSGKPDIKKIHKQFTMPLWPKEARPHRLHLIAILQSINDQVEILQSQE